jgi:hypothetical protein
MYRGPTNPGTRVRVSDLSGDREAVVFATGMKDGRDLVYLDDGAWVRVDDIVGSVAPEDPQDGGEPSPEPAPADRSRSAAGVNGTAACPTSRPAEASTLGRSLEVARSILGAFWDNSAFEDYRRADGWTDVEYRRMLADLDRIGEVSTMPAPVVVLVRHEGENGRCGYLGVYSSWEKAEEARQADVEQFEGVYGVDDYALLASKVE